MKRTLAIRWLFWWHRAEYWQQWHWRRSKRIVGYPEAKPKKEWCDK
jgi:hypothetical protein